ncbi:DUF3575 domain-containing protein [Mangrovimonas sp. YM274]|uniref:DUF3575 domain-containing protein n=1 Tax=Mangrovimonas sp. YM274 TaxID=3070660 RepID=UPI0027DB4497|nr:DUF3575 domain-containing protein [Mangrovimonas sp. YM274]WMI69278.1 DUF3575 domain-containing protein [Mangrovimonas sp. YM274]
MKHFKQMTLSKVLTFCAFALFSSAVVAQETLHDNEDVPKRMELKANAFNLIIFKTVDISFEYLIDSESSIGVSALFNLNDPEEDHYDEPYYNERFALTPYYRRYFSSKYAWGFFLEAFGMYNLQEDGYWEYSYDSVNDIQNKRYIEDTSGNIAFGMSVGAKFVSSKGFLFEFYGGVGRNIFTSNDDAASELVPRLGATFGYRF